MKIKKFQINSWIQISMYKKFQTKKFEEVLEIESITHVNIEFLKDFIYILGKYIRDQLVDIRQLITSEILYHKKM